MGEKGKSQGGKSRGGVNIRSFVLRIYIVGRMGVKKFYTDWQVKMVPAFPGVM